jgi:hypothetical protein
MWGLRSKAAATFAGVLIVSSGVLVADELVGQVASVEAASLAWQDINPDTDNGGRNAASGGRVNGLAGASGNNNVYFAASEFGGLYRSTNGGANWAHVAGHLPMVMWDVAVDPANNNNVYATSFYDGRVNSVSGIQRSSDGGTTWTHPVSATPPASGGAPFSSCATARRTEPAAFGVGIHPTNNDVFIGTNCGVARSFDSGATWSFSDPTTATAASDVWDVAVSDDGTANGIVNVCGDDGVFRSADGGANWTNITGTLPGPFGRCSITVSPDENYVLVVNFGRRIWQTNDTGANWNEFTPNATNGGRIPFVETNQRATGFDLWVGQGVSLARAACTTPNPAAPGGADRCPAPGAWTNEQAGAHDDTGDVVFDAAVATDACPRVYSSDGGVFTNTIGGAACHDPTWADANVGLHGLWLYSMGHANQAGDNNEDLYMGLQDNGAAGSTNAGANVVTWNYPNCCDVFNIAADPTRVVWDLWSGYSQQWGTPGMATTNAVATFLPGSATQGVDLFTFPDNIDTFGANQYVAVSGSGAFTTNDITANPVVWTPLGSGTPGGGFCGVQAAVSSGTPTFYAQTGCLGVFESGANRGPFQLWRLVGTGGTWDRVDDNFSATSGIEIFAVDPSNPNRLYASHLSGAEGARMIFSTDGGTTWNVDDDLTALMDGFDAFKMQPTRGATSFTGVGGYVQPSLVAFDPEDPNVIVAGGRDSGIFYSNDAGQNWTTITDPLTSNTSGTPHIPRPFFAAFDHEPAGTVTVFVGTQGRGVWRVRLRTPIADAGGPYTTPEGTDVTLTAAGSSDPDGQPLTYAWDLDNDGAFDDASGLTANFDTVGQDDTFTVKVKVTANGVSDVDDATVTVTNVAPAVTGLASNSPRDENTVVTVTGLVSDPGWLDPLTATIDWGDGAGPQPIAGTLENIRPDATINFSVDHTYGDDGIFAISVCGSDDDTTACASAFNVVVNNVNPTAMIDEGQTTLVNGIPTILAHAGETITFSGRSTDPGSDDLTLSWDFDDGTPAPDTSTPYLVNPPGTDPDPSPTVQPRDVTDMIDHAFADACIYQVGFTAADDDAGTAADSVAVLVTGNQDNGRPSGYWSHQYRRQGATDFDDATLTCYLEIVDFVSDVFHEARNVSTFPLARSLLFTQGASVTKRDQLDRDLLTVWLNLANGAVEWDELVDTNRDGAADTVFHVAVETAETVRLNPASTNAQFDIQRSILQSITDTI